MTFEQIRTLCAIVEEGGFRPAAERLHKSQSSLSYAIRQLEDEFKLRVFSRESYRPELTDAGRALYERAKGLLQNVAEFEDLGRQLSQGVEAEVDLALSALTPLPPLIPVLREFAKRFPHTRLRMSVEIFGALEKVRDGRAQLAITEGRDLDPGQFEVEPHCPIKLIPVVAPSHPLGRRQKEISQSMLMNFPHLILRSTGSVDGRSSAGIMEGAFTWSLPDFQTKMTLLKAGLGWGHMPHHLVEKEIRAKVLVKLKVPEFKGLEENQWVVRRRGQNTGLAQAYLWRELTKVAKRKI
ncbi:MAG: LysR family transcriptional regulator [Bdellovibrionaceae bacterium]|nr:LysR family transcriptional regulator [Bdellovibrionales bacterium]MCB9085014.1 LysR family transcriptional regulator [Pseudobdellovibrionaceae bacterium]